MEVSGAAKLLDAILFAAERHKNQRRKDAEASPYINHPIALAHFLATVGGITDTTVLQAAVLHDTIEDTETTEEELRSRFGNAVTDIVLEVTDDKALPKQRRKELQVEHAPHKSPGAALVKLADKTCNLRDIATAPPADWSLERRQEYFDWARNVVDGLPKVNDALLSAFDLAYEARPKYRGKVARDDGSFSLPSALKGAVGLVRSTEKSGVEVELYDFGEHAHNALGSDAATIYTIDAQNLEQLSASLAKSFGGDPAPIEELPERLCSFLTVESLIDWLTAQSGVPFSKRVDFDA